MAQVAHLKNRNGYIGGTSFTYPKKQLFSAIFIFAMSMNFLPHRSISKSKKRKSPTLTASAGKKIVRDTILESTRSELKDITFPVDDTGTAATFASLDCSPTIQQGSDSNERIGRKIQLHSLRVKGTVSKATAGGNTFRIVAVYDKAPNGAAPAVTTVFHEDTPLGMPNTSFRDRFIILRDMTIDLFSETATSHIRHFDFYVPLKGLVTRYSGNAGTIADVVEGNIALYWVSSATGDILASNARITYLDY